MKRLIESYHDDDVRTSSTQMKRGMQQTINDLSDIFGFDNSEYFDSDTS